MTTNPDLIETIAAVATPPGRGGVAVLRVSGPLTKRIAESVLKKPTPKRQAVFSQFHALNDDIIDHGLAVLFEAPHSYTGEDVLELYTHGSPVITDWLMETLIQFGARQARAGEFSERAFLNGKMDLTKAEAISDLIDSSSRAAAKCALRSLKGVFSDHINILLEALISLRIQVEAAIDFSDEEINFAGNSELINRLNKLIDQMKQIFDQATEGSRLCSGLKVVIAGKPNAGKSSLLNALSGRSAAIVTDIPGTTRDVLREDILLKGLSIQLTDTAGLRDDSDDAIEQEGIRRAKQEMSDADIVLWVVDAYSDISTEMTVPLDAYIITVRNKIDLINENPARYELDKGHAVVSLSAHTQNGLDLLAHEIRRYSGITDNAGLFSARRRHLEALKQADSHMQEALKQISIIESVDTAAEELRLAQLKLSEITGAFTPDDLLGRIFSSFCIGK